MTANDLHCTGCGKRARWYVWFAGFELYGYACDKHAKRWLAEGKDGNPVSAIQLLPTQYLSATDEAGIRMREMETRHRTADEKRGAR